MNGRTRYRIDWSDEELIDQLRTLYEDGEAANTIASLTKVSETSIKFAATTFGFDADKRKEGIVRRYWHYRPPGSIAQAFRIQRREVEAIAKRLNLGPATKHYEADRYRDNRKLPWSAETIRWAEQNRDHRESAHILGEMERLTWSRAHPSLPKAKRILDESARRDR